MSTLREQKELEQRAELSEDSDDEEEMNEEGIGRARMKLVPMFPMYPCVEEKRVWDVYGEIIVPDDYKSADKENQVAFLSLCQRHFSSLLYVPERFGCGAKFYYIS